MRTNENECVIVYLFFISIKLCAEMNEYGDMMEILVEQDRRCFDRLILGKEIEESEEYSFEDYEYGCNSITEYAKDYPKQMVLYAFTEDKKLAKNFLKKRNKSVFHPYKYKMTKEERDDFSKKHHLARIYARSSGGLITKRLYSKDVDITDKSMYYEADVPVTDFEYSVVEGEEEYITTCMDEVDEMIREHTRAFSILYKCGTKKVKKALLDTRIIQLLNLIDYMYSDDNFKDASFSESINVISTDELYIIIKYFGRTF